MKEAVKVASAMQSAEGALGSKRSRRWLIYFLGGWTLLTVATLWWLFTKGGPTVLIVHSGDGGQLGGTEHFQALFKAETGFPRLYPWALLGPYVAWLALLFPLERGRLRINLPLNIAGCIAFTAGSQAIDSRVSLSVANVTVIKWPANGGALSSVSGTNVIDFDETNFAFKDFAGEKSDGLAMIPTPAGHRLTRIVVRERQGSFESGESNLLYRASNHLKPPFAFGGLKEKGVGSTLLDLIAYGAVVGLAHSVHFYRRFREREHRALVLETNLAHARLNSLRSQLQPHFLFNSLNAVAALLRRDARLAESTLVTLSELLRLSLNQSDRQEVPLSEELEFVQRYVQIQQMRFGDKLRFEQDIDPAALGCLVPSLLLQPLIENSIRHGIEPSGKAGLMRVTAQREGEQLVLTVADDGVGLARPASAVESNKDSPTIGLAGGGQAGNGIGLSNLRARLEMLYGSGQKLSIGPGGGSGVNVRVEIPWRPTNRVESDSAQRP